MNTKLTRSEEFEERVKQEMAKGEGENLAFFFIRVQRQFGDSTKGTTRAWTRLSNALFNHMTDQKRGLGLPFTVAGLREACAAHGSPAMMSWHEAGMWGRIPGLGHAGYECLAIAVPKML